MESHNMLDDDEFRLEPTVERPKVKKEQPVEPGLKCPECGCSHLPVWYTRSRGDKIVRVRKCRNCGRRVSTTERIIG